MFNFNNILDAVKNLLAKAETISPEIIAVANEVRQGASALGVLTPDAETEIAGHVLRLTGSLDGLAPVGTQVAGSIESVSTARNALANTLSASLSAPATETTHTPPAAPDGSTVVAKLTTGCKPYPSFAPANL